MHDDYYLNDLKYGSKAVTARCTFILSSLGVTLTPNFLLLARFCCSISANTPGSNSALKLLLLDLFCRARLRLICRNCSLNLSSVSDFLDHKRCPHMVPIHELREPFCPLLAPFDVEPFLSP